MTKHPSETPRRGRGRPRGSTPYEAMDARIMLRAGDAILKEPTLSNRAAILRAVVKETAKPVEQERALRRVQGKMDRDLMIAEAAERKTEVKRKAEDARRELLTILEFAADGPTFQRFIARSDVQEFARTMAMFNLMTHQAARTVAQALAPVYATIEQAQRGSIHAVLHQR